MENFKVKDLKLAGEGQKNIEWATHHMPVLSILHSEFEKSKPFKGIKIGCCLHMTKETAVLAKTLRSGGADVYLCGSNPLSTKDDVCAALAKDGIHVYAWHGVTNDEYYWCIEQVLQAKPHILIDDGADLISTAFKTNQYSCVMAGLEETTTGVIRFKAMEKDGVLKFPIFAINNAHTKMLLDNYFGTGQSTIDGILRATNILIAGKTFVIAGFGNCGKGLARRALGMGAKVVVTETDPRKAIQAFYEGYQVMPMIEAAKIGDIFVTVTGNRDIIRKEHFKVLKPGAIIANSGHFDVEINLKDLQSMSTGKRTLRPSLEEYSLPQGKVYVLGEGRLVNLAAAEGHPSEIMQTSFCNQALMALHAVQHAKSLQNKVYDVPIEIDSRTALLALQSYGVSIDTPTKEQDVYMSSWKVGT